MCEHNKFSWIDGFGEELDELVYEGMSNWFVSFRSLTAIFGGHFSYFIVHICIIACGIMTLRHARANGPRFLQFWCGAMVHGILSESGVTASRYWHAQAFIMLFGKRLPLHMVFFYPSMLYMAMMAVQRFKLNVCSECAAVGLLTMLLEIPFRMISVKFLHITYHDSDPVYATKFYGVPWIEIFSDLVLATSYVAVYYTMKKHFLSEEHLKWERVEYEKKEAIMATASGVISPISGFLQKVIFFHILHDSFNVSPSTCLLFLCSIYFSVVFCMDEKDNKGEREPEGKKFLYYALGIYIACLTYIAMFGRPQNEISIGVHEPTGDCTTLLCSRSPLGKIVKRKKYLCVDDVQERTNFVYNFSCLPDGPPYLNALWYTICGTGLRNRAQFLTNTFSFVILTSAVFLKAWLSEEEKEKILNLVSKINPFSRRGSRRSSTREPVVTFEERSPSPAQTPTSPGNEPGTPITSENEE